MERELRIQKEAADKAREEAQKIIEEEKERIRKELEAAREQQKKDAEKVDDARKPESTQRPEQVNPPQANGPRALAFKDNVKTNYFRCQVYTEVRTAGLNTVCSKQRELQLFCSHLRGEISQINADANLSDFQIR